MKIVVDMNLSPDWVPVLVRAGHSAIHWSQVGPPNAKDSVILAWAREQHRVVFTHDLDFGAILAATNAEAPSVLQIRTQDPSPHHCGPMVAKILSRYAGPLGGGALLTVDERHARVRLLPLSIRPDPPAPL